MRGQTHARFSSRGTHTCAFFLSYVTSEVLRSRGNFLNWVLIASRTVSKNRLDHQRPPHDSDKNYSPVEGLSERVVF